MNPALRPAWTIARGMWMAKRPGFLALGCALLVCGLGLQLAYQNLADREAIDSIANILMGLSLFLTFIFCNFTETDRRMSGFPSWLFRLPVSTSTLIAVPIIVGVLAVLLVYHAWAGFVLPSLGRQLPLAWPSLYLATGMICYLSIVWWLAQFQIARLLALGVGGAVLAVGWLAFRDDGEYAIFFGLMPFSGRLHGRFVLCLALLLAGVSALLIAYLAVESQRRGGASQGQRMRRIVEFLSDALHRSTGRFDSPSRAQFWFEWRRHGILLPLSCTAVLLLVIVPAPFLAPLSEQATMITLGWILLLPLLLAFAIGKGFGKADFWSKEMALPLFLAARPMTNTEWIGAKLKAAALAAVTSWLLVAALASLWLWQWCDKKPLLSLWQIAERIYPASVCWALPALVFGCLVVLTWRLLIDSLFIGLCGRAWMLSSAVCGVFATILGTPFLIMALNRNPALFRHMLRLPVWFPWLLAGLFTAKAMAACWLANHSHKRGWITGASITKYAVAWSAATAFLVLAAWLLIPLEGWLQWLFSFLALFALPLVRAASAPLALACNRQR